MGSELDKALALGSDWGGFTRGTAILDDTNSFEEAAKYYGEVIPVIWGSLPEGIRDKTISAMQELIKNSGGEIGKNLSDTMNSAGPIVRFVMSIVRLGVDAGVLVAKMNKASTKLYYALARLETFGGEAVNEYSGEVLHKTSRRWVFSQRYLKGLPRWVLGERGAVRWAWVSAFPPDQGESRTLFGIPLKKPSGSWSKKSGVALRCPVFTSSEETSWGGCKVRGATKKARKKNAAKRFSGEILINALSWPYFSPSMPSTPLSVFWSKGSSSPFFKTDAWGVDPNSELMYRQSMMLTNALRNLQVSGAKVANATQSFVNWQKRQLGIVGEKFSKFAIETPGRVDNRGRLVGPYSSRWEPDPEMDPDHYPGDKRKRFYFNADGLINAYPGYESEDLDLAKFGYRVRDTSSIACTFADANSLVSSTMAFFTARAAFLQNRAACRAIVEDGWLPSIDASMRSAVEETAASAPSQTSPAAGGLAVRRRAGRADPSNPPRAMTTSGARPGTYAAGAGQDARPIGGRIKIAGAIVAGVGAIGTGIAAVIMGRRG